MRDRRRSERQGRLAEAIAGWWLHLHGWRILARRVRTSSGEVDLIARRKGVVAFVEVKARGSEADLAIAIDRHRLRRVARAAEQLMPRYPAETHRIDVILIAPWCKPRVIENAWLG